MLLGAAALVALAADAAFVALRVGDSLTTAAATLEDARDRFEAGDVAATERLVRDALDDARSALSLRAHPAYVIGSVFADVEAVTELGLAVEDVALAGIAATEAARTLGVTGERTIASTVYEDGRIRFDALDEAAPLIAAADARLRDAARHLDEAPQASLGVVRDAVARATREVESAGASARKGSVLFGALPSLLGRGGSRSYLLAFQALGEARATGGVVGFYGVLDARDGVVELRRAAPIHELGRTESSEPVEAPAWFETNYGPQYALRQALQANVSPRFPVVAEVLLEMYEASRGERLDGVVFMDPITMASLLRSTGPIEVAGLPEAVGADNAADMLFRRSYLDFDDPREQNVYLATLIDEFWRRVSEGRLDGAVLAAAVAEEVGAQHLVTYSRDESDADALAELEADGDFTRAGPSLQLVFNNNYAVNKVDYFLRRSVRTRIDLTFEGDARIRTSVTLHNEAPAGPPSLLLGPPPGKPDDPPGLNRMVLAFLLPEGAQAHQYFPRAGSDPEEPFVYSDSGYPVVWDVVEVPAGETRTVTVTYFVPDALELGPGGGDMSFVLWPQTRVQPDEYRVVATAPDGFVLTGVDDEDGAESGVMTFDGVLDGPAEIAFHMEES